MEWIAYGISLLFFLGIFANLGSTSKSLKRLVALAETAAKEREHVLLELRRIAAKHDSERAAPAQKIPSQQAKRATAASDFDAAIAADIRPLR